MVTATTWATNVEAQREHTRRVHPDAPELRLPVPSRHPNDPRPIRGPKQDDDKSEL